MDVGACAMSRRTADQLARPDFAMIPRYGGGSEIAVNLSDNTNLWGTPPAAMAALARSAAGGAAGYPDLYGRDLKQVVANLAGVAPECVVTGNGSDDILDCAIRAFADHGDRIAHPDPTFVMLPVFSRINGVVPVPVPLTDRFEMDVDALLATEARIIYLCSPNNPTSTATPAEAIRRVIKHAPGLVIIDEAYAEFSGEPGFLSEAPGFDRVLVCRTLSKAYGLAGLRVGYGTASPQIVETIERSRGPYKLNTLAESAAVAAMTDDRDWVAARAAEAVANRNRLAVELRTLGLEPLESATNFLCVPTRRAAAIAARLRDTGISVRAFQNLPGIGDALRITAAPWELMQRVIDVVRETAS
jgi:histidinol-phosphate aminotransferase